MPTVNDTWKDAFENISEKGENVGNQDFILFPQCLSGYQRKTEPFQKH